MKVQNIFLFQEIFLSFFGGAAPLAYFLLLGFAVSLSLLAVTD